MKKIYITLWMLISITACNTYKKAEKNLYSGNFDNALDGMIQKYQRSNISQKDMDRWGGIFFEAYHKAKDQNLTEIQAASFMQESIQKHRILLANYSELQTRVDKIKPILPIRFKQDLLTVEGINYYTEIARTRYDLSVSLNKEADRLIATSNKMNARIAFDMYKEISILEPGFSQIHSKIDDSYQNGLSHTLVTVNNDSRIPIPYMLQHDITNFNAYGIESFWNILHTSKDNSNYDYYLELNFRDIAVSPERIDRQHFEVSKEIASKDTSKKAKPEIITCRVKETRLFKEASINSEIVLLDHKGRIVHRESPLVSTFAFNYTWAEFFGNKEAVDKRYLREVKCQSITIPSNEQMVFDCAQDLKSRFKNFIQANVVSI